VREITSIAWPKENDPAVIQLLTDDDTTTLAPTSFGELMVTFNIIAIKCLMPQGTSRPGSGHMRLGFSKPHLHKYIVFFMSKKAPDSSLIRKVKPVELIRFYPCIELHKLNTM